MVEPVYQAEFKYDWLLKGVRSFQQTEKEWLTDNCEYPWGWRWHQFRKYPVPHASNSWLILTFEDELDLVKAKLCLDI